METNIIYFMNTLQYNEISFIFQGLCLHELLQVIFEHILIYQYYVED